MYSGHVEPVDRPRGLHNDAGTGEMTQLVEGARFGGPDRRARWCSTSDANAATSATFCRLPLE
jgi:hypothetical protein